MDLEPEELQFLTIPEILRESIAIPKRSPKTFYLITLTLIFPLSFAILAHSLFTYPLLAQLEDHPSADPNQTRHEWTLLMIFQFCYLIFLFAFSLLSTAAVVFTRLFITFLWVSLLMLLYNSVILIFLVVFVIAVDTLNVVLLFLSLVVIFVFFLVVHVYITALWHLASVVSVLEPIYGIAAMKKSYQLLKGRARMAAVLGFFGSVVVHGGDKYGVFTRIVVGGFFVGVLVIVNLVH
ncbi:hypothetical protein P3X46_024801 [Hevea brasiliensis]|uniref:Uncharacterized protein n=1 Tax=Hevea brasiliensis TaxID=3981 RepID=A0ABQ9L783_HEVBR|nr:hypothetical protein P3X46_024801 [Hevea brasiliensis]